MPLTAAQITQVFEIIGIPQSGSGDVFSSVATLFGPEYESYDMTSVVTLVTERLNALGDTQISRVSTLLDRYTAITATSPLQVGESAGARGTLADHPAEREAIRAALGNIAGVAVPSGGFFAEARRIARKGGTVSR